LELTSIWERTGKEWLTGLLVFKTGSGFSHSSYRGRCLVIINLAASMMWHKVTLILKVQRAFAVVILELPTLASSWGVLSSLLQSEAKALYMLETNAAMNL